MAISINIDADTIRNLSMNVNTEGLTHEAQRLLDGLNAMARLSEQRNNKTIELTDAGSYKSGVLWHGREDVEYLLENEQFLESNQKELDSFSPEELESFIDTVTAAVDWEGPVFTSCEAGYQVISDAIERQLAASRNTRRVFVPDDELTVEDNARECIDAYLWATHGLMEKLKEQVDNQTMIDLSRKGMCPNFYATFNVREQSVAVVATYWLPSNAATGKTERHEKKDISLTGAEKAELISALEHYCTYMYSKDCLEFVNEARAEFDLPEIKGPTLDEKIRTAEAKQPVPVSQQPEKEPERA